MGTDLMTISYLRSFHIGKAALGIALDSDIQRICYGEQMLKHMYSSHSQVFKSICLLRTSSPLMKTILVAGW